MWWATPNSSTNSTNSAHTARRPYGTTSIGFAPPNGRPASPTRSWCPLMFAPHCLSTKRQADIVASLGTHINSGNPIEVVPLRATTGLCGGGSPQCDSSAVADTNARKHFATTKSFALDFSLCTFPLFPFFAFSRFGFLDFPIFRIVQCDGATLLVAGDDPCERASAIIRRGERSVT